MKHHPWRTILVAVGVLGLTAWISSAAPQAQVTHLQAQVASLQTQVGGLQAQLSSQTSLNTQLSKQTTAVQVCLTRVRGIASGMAQEVKWMGAAPGGISAMFAPLTDQLGLGVCSRALRLKETKQLRTQIAGAQAVVDQEEQARTAAYFAAALGPVTAICNDGTSSYSQHASGTCSYHGGVQRWVNYP